MATLEQIGAALKAADAAGDTEGARRLAAAYRAMQGSAQAAPAAPGSPEDDAQRRARGVPTDAEYSASIQRMNSEDPLADENPFVIQGVALNNSLRNTGMGLLQANAEGTAAMVDNPITRGVAGAIGLGDEQRALASVTQGRADQLRQGQEDYERVTESRLQNNPVFRRSDTTFDVAQAVVPGMGAARATQGASLLGRLGADAAVGAAQGGTRALGEGESRGTEAAIGAALNSAGTAAGAGLSRAARGLSDYVRPAMREFYDAAKASGMQPSISGLLDNGGLKATTEFLRSLPFAGGAKAINRELSQFTEAMGKTFGLNEKELSKAAMKRAEDALSAQYDATLSGQKVMLDTNFIGKVNQILRDAPQSIDAPQRAILKQNVDRLINAAATGSAMPATLYQELRGVLAQNAKRTGAQGVSDHILDLRKALDDAAVRSIGQTNPAAAQGLMDLNRAWANFSKAEELLSAPGGRAGLISPKAAASATRPASSPTGGPRSTTTMRNLAEAADKTGMGTGVKTDLPWWQKLVGGAALSPAGMIVNSERGSRYLAEGLPPQARALAEQLGILTRAAPAASTRAKRRKEIQR